MQVKYRLIMCSLVTAGLLALAQTAQAQEMRDKADGPEPGAPQTNAEKQNPEKISNQQPPQKSVKPERVQARRPAVRSKARLNFEPDPNAKWVCAENTVTLEPVWRGAKSLTFDFDIKNGGTADLRIRAKGG